MSPTTLLNAEHHTVSADFFERWCLSFRRLLVQRWPGLIGLIIDGGLRELVSEVFTVAQRKGDQSWSCLDQEVERWARLEFPEYPIGFFRIGSLSVEQLEDLDLAFGLDD